LPYACLSKEVSTDKKATALLSLACFALARDRRQDKEGFASISPSLLALLPLRGKQARDRKGEIKKVALSTKGA
jgi:hypothetical protein